MSWMQLFLLLNPPVKSFSTSGTPCLRSWIGFAIEKKGDSRLCEWNTTLQSINISRNIKLQKVLTLWSAQGISSQASAAPPELPDCTISSDSPWICKVTIIERVHPHVQSNGPVEESHQPFPFVELGVLVASRVEHNLNNITLYKFSKKEFDKIWNHLFSLIDNRGEECFVDNCAGIARDGGP